MAIPNKLFSPPQQKITNSFTGALQKLKIVAVEEDVLVGGKKVFLFFPRNHHISPADIKGENGEINQFKTDTWTQQLVDKFIAAMDQILMHFLYWTPRTTATLSLWASTMLAASRMTLIATNESWSAWLHI